MKNRKEAYSFILSNEGFKQKIYLDSAGIETIGVGRNLKARPFTKFELNYMNTTLDRIREYGLGINAVYWIYERDLDDSIISVRNVFGSDFDNLSDNRQIVLVDMCFNLGINGLLKFKKMINNLKEGKFDQAADEILNSKAAINITERYKKLANLMRG